MMLMKIIGITGGIGSGKSIVSSILAGLGAVVIDTDKLGHEAFRNGTETWRRVVAAFGEGILASDGEIDRRKLGEIVFADPVKRTQLNEIMHPAVHEMVVARLEELRQCGTEVVVLEVPLLIEGATDLRPLLDEIWVAAATEEAVLARLQTRNGIARESALARIHSQMPLEEKKKHADVIIDNDGTLEELRAQVAAAWHRLQAG
jgi:dephospho-CoA kinase